MLDTLGLTSVNVKGEKSLPSLKASRAGFIFVEICSK